MNCKNDNEELISSSVPHAIQENGTFLIDLDKLPNRKDVFADDNGVWTMKGSWSKPYSIEKDADGQVLSENKSQEYADIVCRRPYVCKSCPDYHKTIISIEYGQDIDKWYPIVLVHYYFEGEPKQFTVAPHGNRKAQSTQPYVRTKESTKEKLAKNVADVKFNTKRALFHTFKDVGGVSGASSTSSLPRNYTQAKSIKQKLGLTPGSSKKSNDPLLAVLELQKSTFPGFIREVVCNDLPTIMLYTDNQLDNIVKFCCHKKTGLISELGLDVSFQLGPFYVLVTTYKNTLLNVKGGSHSPSCMGPVMICMTKEEGTYLSFIHCLLREVPGLSQYLHATGTDSELALRNATAAGMQNAFALLRYLQASRLNWRNWGFLNLWTAKFAVTFMPKVVVCSGQIRRAIQWASGDPVGNMGCTWEWRKKRSPTICQLFSEIQARRHERTDGKVYHARSGTWRPALSPEHSRGCQLYD